MRKSVAVATAATCVAMGWGLATVKPTAPEPGIRPNEFAAQENSAWGRIKHIRYAKAEDDGRFEAALREMTEWCGEAGLPAEVWIERNAAGRLEVLGRCTRTFRSEGP